MTMNRIYLPLSWLLLLATGHAQTSVDLKTQSKSVDFSQATFTKPVKIVTILPVACSVGEQVFLSTAPAGRNLRLCTSLNTWSEVTQLIGGDVSGTLAAMQVIALRGRVLGTGTPSDRQALRWDETNQRWSPLPDPAIPAPGVSSLGGVKSGQCTATTGKLMGFDDNGDRICEVDQAGAPGGGVTSFGGLNAVTQVLGAIGTTGTAPSWTNNGSDTHYLNIPLASVAGVTRGTISKAEYDAFNAKQDAISGAPGTWPSTFLPSAPGPSTLGGVKSGQCTTGTGKLMGFDINGDRICETDQAGAGALTSFGGLSAAAQLLDVPGTSGTAPNWSTSGLDTHILNIPLASAAGVTRGTISKAEYDLFNAKEPALPTGTSAQYFRGDKSLGTLNTDAVAEGSVKYFSNALARAAISGAGAVQVNTSTGIISLLAWGTGSRPVAANALGTPGHCMEWTATGAGDTGLPCGTGTGSASPNSRVDFTAQTEIDITVTDSSRAIVQCADASGTTLGTWVTRPSPTLVHASFINPQDGYCIVNESGVDGTPGASNSVATGLASQYIDWNIATGPQSIANKPTIPSTKGEVGLPNVDNTADSAKPVSTLQQQALDLKANIANPVFTGMVQVGAGGLKLTTNAGALEVRTPAGDTYGPIVASEYRAPDGTAYQESGEEQAKPSAPASGLRCWYDSTDHTPECENASGTVVGKMLLLGTTAGTAAAGNDSRLVAVGKTPLATDGSAASLTNFPTFNQNTTGTAGGLSGTAFGGDATNSGNTITVVKINGITITGAPQVGYVPTATSSSAASWQAPGAGHTQNTDTGTSSTTFQFGTGGIKLKTNAGVLEVRTAADDGPAPVLASEVRAPAGTAFLASGAEQASTVDCGGVPCLIFDSTLHLPLYKNAAGTVVAQMLSSTLAGYLANVTSDVQAQLNTKAALVSPSFTTPALGVATATSINGTAIPSSKTLMATDTVLAAAQEPAHTGDVTNSQGSLATAIAAQYKVRTCEIVIGDPGAASPALADDNDTPAVCANLTGATLTITEVKCRADSSTGSPTVLPIITGGASTTILSGGTPLACGNGVFGSAGTLNDPPTQPTQADGATIDGNISTAGGTAKMITIRIKRTL